MLRRIREASQIWAELENLRRAHRLPERAAAALFDAGIGLRVKNSSYHAGLLRAHGRNRGAFYDAAQPLVRLRAEARRARRAIDTSGLFHSPS